MEQNLIVRGVAFEDEITRVTVFGLPNSMTSLSTIFTTLASNHINVDIIIQSTTSEDMTNLSFSIKTDSLDETLVVLENNKDLLKFGRIETEIGLAKVSIVGSGMISNPGVAAEMFEALAKNNIQIKMVSTSEIKVSTVVEKEHMLHAVQVLHDTFELAGAFAKA